jgi:hypothetical protein
MSAGGILCVVGGAFLVLGLLAWRSGKAARRRERRMISMRWSEIAAARQREGRIKRAGHAARRGFGRATGVFLLAGVCFAGVGLATLLATS